MSMTSPMIDLEEAIKDLSTSISKVEKAFKSIDIDEYEAELFFKGLSDSKTFVANLNWIIKRHSM